MRDKQNCPCGECEPGPKARYNVRNCPATPQELLLLARARKLSGPKLAAMLPAWIKREQSYLPKPIAFVPDKAPAFPRLPSGTVWHMQHKETMLHDDPFEAAGKCKQTAAYVRAYEKAAGLRSANGSPE